MENPASSLTFHDPLMISWIQTEAPFCAQVASCMYGASFSKSWMFVCNQPSILDLACSCSHEPGSHTFLARHISLFESLERGGWGLGRI